MLPRLSSVVVRSPNRKAVLSLLRTSQRQIRTTRAVQPLVPLNAAVPTSVQAFAGRQVLTRHTIRTYASAPMAAPTDTAAEEVANATGITPDTLAETLRQKLGATHVDVQDISGGCGASFTALIVSPQFQGKATLARHRLVNSALKSEIAAIHAWTPRCLTPEQWDKLQQESSSA